MMRPAFNFFCALLLFACGDSSAPAAAKAAAATPAPATSGPQEQPAEAPRETLEQLETELGFNALSTPWTGDLDGMAERRLVRVLTVYGLGRYFIEGAQERGPVYEGFTAWDKALNESLKNKHVRVHVVFIPVARDELLSGLVEGRGDIAAAGLTITPERLKLVDFTDPLTKELSEILVTGPAAPPIDSVDGLSGKEVHVRASSSYRSSLDELNRRFRQEGKPEVILVDAPESLEDEDLLQMVQAGMLPWVVVDDYKATAWHEAFPEIVARNDIVLRKGGRIGYAFRKNSPQLKASLNAFVKDHKQGTLFGNMMLNRYIFDFDWPKNALASEDYDRFKGLVNIFKTYGEQYGLDYLMVAAQGYQESQLDQSRRSKAGAIGVMQMLPSTAADPNVGIPDISTAENNIHAGIKYLDYIRTTYFDDPKIDRTNKTLFALASYNAGPNRIQSLRQKAAKAGYDPNKWFSNVEIIAAQEIGRETVQYVANITKYYAAYYFSLKSAQQRMEERDEVGLDKPGKN